MIPGIDDPSKAEHLAAHIHSRKITADQVRQMLEWEGEGKDTSAFWDRAAHAAGVAKPSRKARVLVAELVTKLEADRG